MALPLRHLSIALIPCAVWAFNFIGSAHAMGHFDAFLFTALRLSLVLLILAPWMRMPPIQQWRVLVIAALCNGALHFGISFWGLKLAADVSSVAILMQSYIPMAALLSVWMLGEKLGRWRASAISVAFLGVLVVGFDPLVLRQLDAMAMVILSSFFLAVGTVMLRRLKGVDPFSLQGWSALISLPALLILSLAFESEQWLQMQTAHWTHWGTVIYAAVFASIVGHGLVFWLLQRHPVGQVTPILLLTPILAVALGVLVWGDRPGPRLLIGGALVIAGVAMIALGGRRKSAS